MKYARIEAGLVVEIIEPFTDAEGRLVPIEERFHPDIVAHLVEYDPAHPPVEAPAPAPTVAERIATLAVRVQAALDAAAQALGYDDIKTAVTYADEPAVAKFEAEGKALRAWRSLVWAKCYEVLGQWQAGQVAEPSGAELIAMLPAFEAPVAA